MRGLNRHVGLRMKTVCVLSVANYFFNSSIAVLQRKKTNKLPSSCGVEKISWTFNLLISKR